MESRLSKFINPEHVSQNNLKRKPQSNRFNDFLVSKTIPGTLYGILLTFGDTDKKCELEGDLLKILIIRNYNIDLASFSDKKLLIDFAEEMTNDGKALGNKNTCEKPLVMLLKSRVEMAMSLKKKSFSNTRWLSSAQNELGDRMKILLRPKQAGSKSNIIGEENFAMAGKILEYKSISKKQRRFLLLKWLN